MKPLLDGLTIIGTTTPVRPEDMPARIEPIYQSQEGECYLAVDGDTPDSIWLDPVDSSWIATQQEDGDVELFEKPLPARAGHVLLMSRANQVPDYLPESELSARLAELAQEALRLAGRAVEIHEHDAAEAYAWYATRAMPHEPFPLLVLHALLEGNIPAQQLVFIEKDLAAFTKEQQDRALDASDAAMRPLIDLVRVKRASSSAPAKVTRRPAYLLPFHDEPTFLKKARRRVAPAPREHVVAS